MKDFFMKIMFWGTPYFAVPTLKSLHESSHEVLGVVTQPDKRQGRKKTLQPSPVKEYAVKNNIAIFQPENPNDSAFIEEIQKFNADIMILAAYGRILKKKLLNIAPHGFFNIHFSLLPKYRGSSPISAAILNGESETGVTIMRIVRKMDAGAIVQASKINITKEDTRGGLEEKLGELGAKTILDVLVKLENGQITDVEQNEDEATYCGMIKKDDGKVDWSKDATYIERLIRAMDPWPTAYSNLQIHSKNQSMRIILKKADVVEEKSETKPGTIMNVSEKGIIVATGKNAIRILELQKSGKKPMVVSEFLRGNPVLPGDTFDELGGA